MLIENIFDNKEFYALTPILVIYLIFSDALNSIGDSTVYEKKKSNQSKSTSKCNY